tara:strand:+ start:901 stop:1098 length:198 start_codon:yes stop_codon:yes gene_type:complete
MMKLISMALAYMCWMLFALMVLGLIVLDGEVSGMYMQTTVSLPIIGFFLAAASVHLEGTHDDNKS